MPSTKCSRSIKWFVLIMTHPNLKVTHIWHFEHVHSRLPRPSQFLFYLFSAKKVFRTKKRGWNALFKILVWKWYGSQLNRWISHGISISLIEIVTGLWRFTKMHLTACWWLLESKFWFIQISIILVLDTADVEFANINVPNASSLFHLTTAALKQNRRWELWVFIRN